MPFDDRDDDNEAAVPQPARKIGVRKENQVVPGANNAQTKANFENQADAKYSKIEDYKKEIWDLSIKYKSFVESKILPGNRGPIAVNLEKEVLDKLVQLALDMNEDDTQQQGVGSTAICMLLMKCMLLQRDTINTLMFKTDQLEKKLAAGTKPE